MIKKITTNDYQKRFDNMNAGERQELKDRVGQWLCSSANILLRRADAAESQLQNVSQVSGRWNDQECAAWDDGVLLLTSFSSVTDTWLPDRLYIKSASRSIRRLVRCLRTMGEPDGEKPVAVHGQDMVMTRNETERSSMPDSLIRKTVGESFGTGTGTKSLVPQNQSVIIPRPKHIDQYVHLLPRKTQERAAKYGQLMRDMEAARENMRLLMNDPSAKDSDREKWAKTATSIDTQVKRIRKELDTEWEKVVKDGRVVVDDLGNARIVNPDGKPSGIVDGMTPEEKAKVRSLRTWLRDIRSGNGEKRNAYVERWKEKYLELVAIGGTEVLTEAIREAAKHYGINIDELQ